MSSNSKLPKGVVQAVTFSQIKPTKEDALLSTVQDLLQEAMTGAQFLKSNQKASLILASDLLSRLQKQRSLHS